MKRLPAALTVIALAAAPAAAQTTTTDPATKAVISGVIGLGLPDLSELGWRWKTISRSSTCG
jgi:hypothetical protein